MSAETQGQTGVLKTAVKHAMELLSAGESGLAKEQAEEILQKFPDEINSQFVFRTRKWRILFSSSFLSSTSS